MQRVPDRFVVNVDLDGVVYDFTRDAIETIREHYGPENVQLRKPFRRWGFHQNILIRMETDNPEPWVPISGSRFWKILDSAVEAGTMFNRPGFLVPGAKDALEEIMESGAWIRIVTSKALKDRALRHRAIENVVEMLRRENIPYDEISFAAGPKVEYVADVVIDDKPMVDDWRQDGATNIIFAQPWNEEIFSGNEWLKTDGSRGILWSGLVRLGWDMIPEVVRRCVRENWHRVDDLGGDPGPVVDPGPVDDPRSAAEEALSLVYGDRHDDYGHPLTDYRRTAALWTALLGLYHADEGETAGPEGKLNDPISPEEAARMMVLLKMARQTFKAKRDNVVDAHGYLLVEGRIRNRLAGLE